MPCTEAYKQLIFNGSEILNLRLCVAFSPLSSLHFHFSSLIQSQTDSTCVAILRPLPVQNSHWPLARLHLLGSHQLPGQLLWLFIAFHTYLSERPVALTSLTCQKFSFHIQPLTCLGASCPVFLLRVTAVTAHSLLLSGTKPSTCVTDSLAPPDSGCHFSSCIPSLLLIVKLSPSML